jgi:hypothetical protein
MVGSFGEHTFTSSTLEGIPPRLIVVHQSDRKHVTGDDVKRLQSQGFVVLFVEYVSKVREIAADAEVQP